MTNSRKHGFGICVLWFGLGMVFCQPGWSESKESKNNAQLFLQARDLKREFRNLVYKTNHKDKELVYSTGQEGQSWKSCSEFCDPTSANKTGKNQCQYQDFVNALRWSEPLSFSAENQPEDNGSLLLSSPTPHPEKERVFNQHLEKLLREGKGDYSDRCNLIMEALKYHNKLTYVMDFEQKQRRWALKDSKGRDSKISKPCLDGIRKNCERAKDYLRIEQVIAEYQKIEEKVEQNNARIIEKKRNENTTTLPNLNSNPLRSEKGDVRVAGEIQKEIPVQPLEGTLDLSPKPGKAAKPIEKKCGPDGNC